MDAQQAQYIVLDGMINVADVVQYILDHYAPPSTLVVCSTKAIFIAALQQALQPDVEVSNLESVTGTFQDGEIEASHTNSRKSKTDRFAPTMRLLFTSNNVKIAFCPDTTHLRAYLASYKVRLSERGNVLGSSAFGNGARQPCLIIVNLVQSQRHSSSYSVQGLSRSVSAAVEAAYQTSSQMILVECPLQTDSEALFPTELHSSEDNEASHAASNPWDEEVSILNVTTKSFGPSERGWAGRTVKIKDIAQRWCVFEGLDRSYEGHRRALSCA